MTPLLDVLFILLFALLALSDTRTSRSDELVRIQLPEVEVAPADLPGSGRRLSLEIDADSRIRLAGAAEVLDSPGDLDRVLAEQLDGTVTEEVTVEIQGHRDAHHGVAVQLLQHLRLRGYTNVALIAVGVDDPTGWGQQK